jgi:hypothetical protein
LSDSNLMLKLTIDDRQLKAGLKKLDGLVKNIPKHMAQSVNKALDIVKPLAAAEIESRYNISGVESNLKINKATAGNLAKGSIEGMGGMIPATEFSPMVERVGNFQRVSIEVIRGRRRVIRPGIGLSRGGFQTGSGMIMERRQDERYPIHPVYRIGIPSMLYYHGISIPMADRLGEETSNHIEKLIMKL